MVYINPQPPVPGFLFGLTLSNSAGSPTTTIDVAAGVAADSANAWLVQLASSLSKILQSTGGWSAGSGGNGLDSGARAAGTWYHVFLIRADSDGSGDILFSTSVSSPALPAGYSYKRRIGSVRTDDSGNTLAFTQTGDEFIWANAMYDVQGVNLGTTSTLYALSVPPDVKVEARIRAALNTTNAGAQGVVRSPDESSSQATGFASGSGHQMQTTSTGASGLAELLIRTNASRQVAAVTDQASGNKLYVRTVGWLDQRGRIY